MDFAYTKEELQFRDELRAWLEANVPTEWQEQGGGMLGGTDEQFQFLVDWQRKLYDAGWGAVHWPKEYGGRDATLIEQLIYQQEMARLQAPPQVNLLGIGLVGPTLIAIGTEEQKKKYLSKILSGEEIWCQGYSEPGAGSDVASLSTKAVKKGDHWEINGQKIWTSLAHKADRCFLLTRTNYYEKKHKGITVFLVDMHQPGVEARPIHQISDTADFNEVFFTNAVAYDEDIVGQIDDGWRITLLLLSFERVSIGGLGNQLENQLKGMLELARTHTRGGVPLIEDPLVRDQLTQFHISIQAEKFHFYRNMTEQLRTGLPSIRGSMDKLFSSELGKAMGAYALGSLLGQEGTLWRDQNAQALTNIWINPYLFSFAMTIAGGTSEIQRNIISEQMLGLPKDIKTWTPPKTEAEAVQS